MYSKNQAESVGSREAGALSYLGHRGQGEHTERRWTRRKRLDSCSTSCVYDSLAGLSQVSSSNKTSMEPDIPLELCDSLTREQGEETLWSLYCCDMERCNVATSQAGQSRTSWSYREHSNK